jgi:hypothetical protein
MVKTALCDGHSSPPDGTISRFLRRPIMRIENRQTAPAGARPAELGEVPKLVTDQRRGQVVQIGDYDLADLARGAWTPVVSKHLDEGAFGLHVIDRMIGALDRDQTRFLATVGIGHADAPRVPAFGSQLGIEHLAQARHFAQARQRDPAFHGGADELPEFPGQREEVLRLLAG